MPVTPVHIPVEVEVNATEVMKGILEIKGLLRYEEEALTFEYRTRNMLWQLSDVLTLEVARDEIREVKLKKWTPKRQVVIYPTQYAGFELVEGVGRDEIAFRMKHSYKDQAAMLVAELQPAPVLLAGAQKIPFTLPDINYGLTEVSGDVYLEDAFLVFAVRTGISGGEKKEQHVIKIELSALEEVSVNHHLYKDRLFIRPRKPDLLEVMPGDHEEALKLKIPHKHRVAAEGLVDEINRRW